jgi:uncharacterized protein
MKIAHYIPKLFLFYAGIIPFALGIATMIQAGVGPAPWDVFHLGVSRQLSIPVGFAIQMVGGTIILLNFLFGIRPGLGTLLNILSIGPIVQAGLAVIPPSPSPAVSWAMLLLGVAMVGLGTALYTSADLGAGPRDGMMIGLTRWFGKPIAWVKNGIDLTVFLLGWAMGARIGIGTLVVALTLGPSVQAGIFLVRRLVSLPYLGQYIKPPQLRKTA